MRATRCVMSWVIASLVTLLPTRSAHAFKFSSPVSDGCHEMITVDAVRAAGWPDDQTPTALSRQERLIAEHLPCDVTGSTDDPWMLALTIGVRFNDLAGLEATDLPGLAEVHNRPSSQREHCLRGPADDWADGDVSALNACRDFMLERIDAAVGAGDSIDLEARAEADVALAFEGVTRVSLQRYGFELGRALHALQDSFTHAFRSPDGMRVRHVTNFVDWADDDASAERDGHMHLDALDLCRGNDARRQRRALATQATVELLTALNDSTLDRQHRREAAAAVITRWLELEPGCTASNAWCDAPERHEIAATCTIAGAPTLDSWWCVLLMLVSLMVRARSHAWPRTLSARRHRWIWGGILWCVCVVNASNVAAQVTTQATTPAVEAASRFGVASLVAGSIDEGAAAWRLGGRLRASSAFEVALDAELNPWFSLETRQIESGSFNVFGSVMYQWCKERTISLRTTLHVGVSVLLFDLVGAPSGSWGPLLGVNLLGVAIDLNRDWKLLIEPAEVMLPIVRLAPFPVYYRQYRLAVGFQLNL